MRKLFLPVLCLTFGLLASPVHAVLVKTGLSGFSASATATRSVPADIVALMINISDESEREEDAARLAAQRGERLVAALGEKGYAVAGVQISNVQTHRSRTRVRVRTPDGLREQILTKVSQRLSLSVSGFKKVSDVLEIVFREGADTIPSVILASSRAGEIENELSLEAIDLAMQRGRMLAGHVDIELGPVVNVSTFPDKQRSSRRVAEPVKATGPITQLGQAVYSVTATVVFEKKMDPRDRD